MDSSVNGKQTEPSGSTNGQGESNTINPQKQKATKPQDVSEGKAPTGAELKKRAKEEKAARRAKEKQEKQATDQSGTLPASQQSHISSDGNTKKGDSKMSGGKEQRRRGSATAASQKQLPIRTTDPQAIPVPIAPKKESKNVSMFSHLYGQPRRTTMAGTGKDINPAVVTLGLKMSHYIICGSNARCVAMLLAFKRVSIYYFLSSKLDMLIPTR